MPAKQYAFGFVIVRDDADGAVYLHRDGVWSTSSRGARVFDRSIHARQWMRTRALGYWLGHPAGRARVISARAAGVTR